MDTEKQTIILEAERIENKYWGEDADYGDGPSDDEWEILQKAEAIEQSKIQAEKRRQKAAEKAALKTIVQIKPRRASLLYENSEGDISERNIEIRAVTGFSEKDNPERVHFEYMEALCFKRRAKRNFRLDRIKRLTDGETGEIVEARNADSVRAWLCDLVMDGEIAPGQYVTMSSTEKLPPRERKDTTMLGSILRWIWRRDV